MERRLKPSLREDKRYLLIEGGSKEEIEKALLEFLGVLGYAKASPKWITQGQQMILAVNREEVDHVRAALTLAKKQIIVKRVSGTLKGLGKK